jgi:hypothetical protein
MRGGPFLIPLRKFLHDHMYKPLYIYIPVYIDIPPPALKKREGVGCTNTISIKPRPRLALFAAFRAIAASEVSPTLPVREALSSSSNSD